MKIFHSRHQLGGVVTQPDKPQGRGKKIFPSPVKEIALKNNIHPVLQPENLQDSKFLETLLKIAADLYVVVAYRILPEVIFQYPPLGTVNLHPSLLPKYRGAAPINWTIINGEKETGNTIIKITKNVDAGEIILQDKTTIREDETAGELHDRLAESGANLLLTALNALQIGQFALTSQPHQLASPAPKLSREHCHISFKQSALAVKNWIHGLSPFPTAYAYYQGERINFFRARIVTTRRLEEEAGTILENDMGQIWIACSPGIIELLELQREGKKRLTASEFLRGFTLETGKQFR